MKYSTKQHFVFNPTEHGGEGRRELLFALGSSPVAWLTEWGMHPCHCLPCPRSIPGYCNTAPLHSVLNLHLEYFTLLWIAL